MLRASPVSILVRAIGSSLDWGESKEWKKELIPLSLDARLSNPDELAKAVGSAPLYSQFVVGRRPNCDVRLKDASVSGWHCALVFLRAPFIKRDLDRDSGPGPPGSGPDSSDVSIYIVDKSTNGTFVDGQQLTKGVPYLLESTQVVSLARGKVPSTSGTVPEKAGPPSNGPGPVSSQSSAFAFTASVIRLNKKQAGETILDLDEAVSFVNDGEYSPLPSFDGEVKQQRFFETQIPTNNNTSGFLQGSYSRSRTAATTGQNTDFGPESTERYLTSRGISLSHRNDSNTAQITPPRGTRTDSHGTRSRSSVAGTQSTLASSGMQNDHSTGSGVRGNSKLADLIKRLQEDNSRKEEELAELAEELDRSNLEKQELRVSLEKQEVQAQKSLEQIARQLNREKEAHRRAIEEFDTQLSVLNNRVDSLTKQLSEIQSEKNHLADQVQQLSDQVRQQKVENDEMRIRVKQTSAQLESSRNENALQQDRWKAEQTHLKRSLDAAEIRAREADQARDNIKLEFERREKILAHLKELLRDCYDAASSISGGPDQKIPLAEVRKNAWDKAESPPTAQMLNFRSLDNVTDGTARVFQNSTFIARTPNSNIQTRFYQDRDDDSSSSGDTEPVADGETKKRPREDDNFDADAKKRRTGTDTSAPDTTDPLPDAAGPLPDAAGPVLAFPEPPGLQETLPETELHPTMAFQDGDPEPTMALTGPADTEPGPLDAGPDEGVTAAAGWNVRKRRASKSNGTESRSGSQEGKQSLWLDNEVEDAEGGGEEEDAAAPTIQY